MNNMKGFELIPVNTTVYVTVQQIADNICAALEGGSTYWCEGFRPDHYPDDCEWGSDAVALGVPFFIRIDGEEDALEVPNSKAALMQALAIMAEHYTPHFDDLVNDRGDAVTGDVLFQLLCFGELVYG